MTLTYKKIELTKFVFGERDEIRMISAKLPSGNSEWKFITYRKEYEAADVDWAIYYILNNFNSFSSNITPADTTWNELNMQLERKYEHRYKKRGLSDVTGPVLWPGYNFVVPGNELTSDVIPVSFVDAVAQMHDYSYG
jgi:hypothetical protein